MMIIKNMLSTHIHTHTYTLLEGHQWSTVSISGWRNFGYVFYSLIYIFAYYLENFKEQIILKPPEFTQSMIGELALESRASKQVYSLVKILSSSLPMVFCFCFLPSEKGIYTRTHIHIYADTTHLNKIIFQQISFCSISFPSGNAK